MGFYTRLNWNYQNVYFLEFSGRYDGSSRFASGNRWGFFPSFSAGYDIARTDYFKQWSLPVSQLKVRLSYGRLGNQNGAGLYDYLNFMTLRPDYSNAWLLSGVTSATPVRGTVALTPCGARWGSARGRPTPAAARRRRHGRCRPRRGSCR